MRFWLAALLVALPSLIARDHLLFSFAEGVTDWRVNVYGTGTLTFAAAEGAMRVRSQALHGGNLISPSLPDGPWRQDRYDRVRFRVRSPEPMTKAMLVFVTDEKTHPTYNLHFFIEQAEWQELTFPLSRCWNRGGQKLDATRLQNVYINPDQPDAEFAIDRVELLAAARQVFLRPDRVPDAVGTDPARVAELVLEECETGGYVLRCQLDSDRTLDTRSTVELQIPAGEPVRVTHEQKLSQGRNRLAIPLACAPKEEGEGRLLWTCLDDQGQVLARQSFAFDIRLPREASLDQLVLIPSPQELKLAEGTFAAGEDELRIQPGPEGRSRFTAGVIQSELAACYGAKVGVRGHLLPEAPARILVGVPERFPELAAALQAGGTELPKLKPEGYLLLVTPEQVLIAGADDRGTYYGARTFLQLVAHATPDGGTPRAPACRILDWPEESFRGTMVFTSGWPQDAFDPEVLKEYLYRQVAGYKFNTVVWQMKAGYRYESWPRLANRCALTREQMRDVVGFARDHFIELIPNTNILGHADWIVLKYPELQEDGKPHQLCTNHPQTYPMLFDVLEEMLDLFDHPKRVHVGLDEVRWKTASLPEAEQCPRCRGIAKYQVYADHINRLHDFLAAKGVQMWMWGDMLIPTHNGGPPFECSKAVDLIPKDIVVCNWSASYSPGSCEMLAKRGFPVAKANSQEMTLADAPYTFGNLASFWYRHPWCPLTQSGERGEMLHQAFAAEYSWHVNREDISPETFARRNDVNVLRLQAQPPRGNGGETCVPIPLGQAASRELLDETAGDGKGWADLGPDLDLRHFPTGEIVIGRAPFTVPEPRAAYLADSAATATIPIGRAAASLLLLHTAVPPEPGDARKAYLARFLAPNEGVPVAELRVLYAGGVERTVPLRVGMEVGFWRPTASSEYLVRCPYLLRFPTAQCQTQHPGSTDAVAYAYEWVNPLPRAEIESIELRHTGTEAAYALFAVSARSPR